jgi:hypothetical protein
MYEKYNKHECSLFWLPTGLSINSGGVKLVEEKCDNNKKQIYFCIFLKLNH